MEMPLIPLVIWEDLSHEKRCCNHQLSPIIKTTTTWSIMVNTQSSHKVKNKYFSRESYGNDHDRPCHREEQKARKTSLSSMFI